MCAQATNRLNSIPFESEQRIGKRLCSTFSTFQVFVYVFRFYLSIINTYKLELATSMRCACVFCLWLLLLFHPDLNFSGRKTKMKKKNIDFKRLALPQYEYMWMDGWGEMCRQTLNVHIFFVKNFFLLFTFYSNANGREQIECRNKQTTILSTREMLFFSSSNFYLVEFVIQKLYCRLLLISVSNPLHWNMTCWAISIFFRQKFQNGQWVNGVTQLLGIKFSRAQISH